MPQEVQELRCGPASHSRWFRFYPLSNTFNTHLQKMELRSKRSLKNHCLKNAHSPLFSFSWEPEGRTSFSPTGKPSNSGTALYCLETSDKALVGNRTITWGEAGANELFQATWRQTLRSKTAHFDLRSTQKEFLWMSNLLTFWQHQET